MISARIQGETRNIGKSQGYLGLSIRDEVVFDKVAGGNVPSMTTAWEPTPAELALLNSGAKIYIQLLGTAHPPILVFVGEPST